MTIDDGVSSWTASPVGAGLSVTPTGKSGDKAIITWAPNTANAIRKGSVIFTITGTSVSTTIEVEQAQEFVEIDGVKWKTGNLVADGANGCKVGAPSDGGLYFQFGSLVGWNGGATGNGVGAGESALAVNVKPTGYTGTDVYTTCGYYSEGTSGSGLPASDVAATGIGDPCRFYLGSPWRTPTSAEFLAAANYKAFETSPAVGRWFGPTSGWNSTNAIFFPASGHRNGTNASYGKGSYGYYWSESVYDAANGCNLIFINGTVYPQDYYKRRFGMPVRCVQ